MSPAQWMKQHGTPVVDQEAKYDDVPDLVDIDAPAATAAAPAGPALAHLAEDEDDGSDDDLSPPDEDLEEGEVPEAELRAHGLLPSRM